MSEPWDPRWHHDQAERFWLEAFRSTRDEQGQMTKSIDTSLVMLAGVETLLAISGFLREMLDGWGWHGNPPEDPPPS